MVGSGRCVYVSGVCGGGGVWVRARARAHKCLQRPEEYRECPGTKLQMAVHYLTWVLGTERGSSTEAVSILNLFSSSYAYGRGVCVCPGYWK